VARYVVERSFSRGWPLSVEACRSLVERNVEQGVTWIQSYVDDGGRQTYCIYEAPSPEAIRKAAAHNRLPVDRIVEVRILDPFLRV
jgi:hypothetical protein